MVPSLSKEYAGVSKRCAVGLRSLQGAVKRKIRSNVKLVIVQVHEILIENTLRIYLRSYYQILRFI